ncbi:MAG: PEP-CTERM sorting domain-containing protein [Burkholderiaceae bacterium]
MLRKFAVAACLSLGTLAYGSASAVVLACPSNISTLVSDSAACQYTLDAADDDVSTVPFTVNQEAFFSFTDWQFDSRIFDAPTGAGGQSGSWDITSIFDSSWTDVMLIFKGGADVQFDMNGLVGYLLEDGVLSGTWESPFRNPPFTDLGSMQTQNTLHISVYFRDDREVAEPTPLALLAFGLIGLGLARRRQRT